MNQEDSTNSVPSDSGQHQAGAAPDVNTPAGPPQRIAAATDPISPASVPEPATDPASATSPGPSSNPDQVAACTGSATVRAEDRPTKQFVKIAGIEEVARTSKTGFSSWKAPFEVEKGCETSIEEIMERTMWVRTPLHATPAPTDSARYGTTDEIFVRLQEAIAVQTCLSGEVSALLTFWTISTWFSDGLDRSPGLAIVGPPHEGNLVLSTLRNYCHFPLMFIGANISDLKNVNWRTSPTLLLYAPNLTKQMASLLGCTSTRGYMISDHRGFWDFYGPKAVYLGEEVPAGRIPQSSLLVRLNPTAAHSIRPSSPMSEAAVQALQNQLFRYRLKNLAGVYSSGFEASALMSDVRPIANALGACIVDSPKLQSQLISLLTPAESQRLEDRSSSLEGVTIEATLDLCHQGKTQVLVGDISNEVNRIAKVRGERLNCSAEMTGHKLKRVGLVTRRLGSAGRGLVMDLTTVTRVHELAVVYGVGLDHDEKNLHCPLCAETK
jgi:hypothetical protein